MKLERWWLLAAALPWTACGGGSGGESGGGEGSGGDAGDAGPESADASWDPTKQIFGMVVVPPGSFFMGCNTAVDDDCQENEEPQHEVWLDGYQIDSREVTNDAYAKFLTEHGNECTIIECYDFDDDQSQIVPQGAAFAPVAGRAPFPVAEVNWFGAREYCTWAGKRLCTEAEWEKAARGGCELYGDCAAETPTYPWGNDAWTCEHTAGQGCGVNAAQIAGGLKLGASPYGAYDMAGNVWEWTADIYAPDYYASSPSANPTGADIGDYRVVRGGSYASSDALRSAYRGAFAFPYMTASTLGFRCCADL